eukprot:m.95323 g.95323  ORF g.95323 m.95323 type:complete len:52 (+) comp51284_c0_seq37:245-400(+)
MLNPGFANSVISKLCMKKSWPVSEPKMTCTNHVQIEKMDTLQTTDQLKRDW